MKISRCPHEVLSRLIELDERCAALGQSADQLEQEVERSRAILGGRLTPKGITKDEVIALREGFADLFSRSQAARHAHRIEQRLLSNAKQWLESLPTSADIVAAPVTVDDHDLESVRAELQTKRTRLKLLRSLPMPRPDIAAQVANYVAVLQQHGAPVLRDIDSHLQVHWPQSSASNPRGLDGYSTDHVNALLFAAWFDGDHLADRLIEQLEREVNAIMPPAQRQPEINRLEAEVDQLLRADVQLAEQADAVHDEGTNPQALLGVVVQERDSVAA